jgi:hypothetical protein
MTETFRCGDAAALVGFVYDDCPPGERDAIAAHLLTCQACAGELELLSGTRQQLASWTPPETRLGFRVAPADADVAAVLPFGALARQESRRWWQQPLPAWAQLAAASAIFAAGMAIGATRATTSAAVTANPSDDLRPAVAALEQRLAGVERARAVSVPVPANDTPILRRVRSEIAESEERQRVELQAELAYRILQLRDSQHRQFTEQIENNLTNVRAEFSALRNVSFPR